MFLIASFFLEGRAVASTDGENLGFSDFTGNFVVPPRFSRCSGFSKGLAAVCMDGRWGFIDSAGKLEIPTVFEGPTPKGFRDGIAGVQIDGRWGFINRSGSFLIKPEYEGIKPFSEGRACVKRNGKWGLIDTDGRLVVECQFDELGPLNANMAPAKIVKLGKTYSYIQRDGQIVWTSQPLASLQYPPPPLFV